VNFVPAPLILRKSGSAGNRTRTSGSVARNSDYWTAEAIFLRYFSVSIRNETTCARARLTLTWNWIYEIPKNNLWYRSMHTTLKFITRIWISFVVWVSVMTEGRNHIRPRTATSSLRTQYDNRICPYDSVQGTRTPGDAYRDWRRLKTIYLIMSVTRPRFESGIFQLQIESYSFSQIAPSAWRPGGD
jgi:hypothetical protein